MLEEDKSNMLSNVAELIEHSDYDRLSRYLEAHVSRLSCGAVDCLFLSLCEQKFTHPQYELCLHYLLG